MPRIFIRTAIAVALTLLASSAVTCAQDSAAREVEWRSHKLPSSDFVRFVHPSKTIMLRVPAGWKQQGAEAKFDGPDRASIQLFIEKIPDGLPLQAVVTGALKSLRNLPGGSDSLSVRRTQLSGGEAREILFELPDAQGNLGRTILLCAVDGPNAITMFFSVPLARAAELEPYFKAVVQSAVIFRSEGSNDFHYEAFESLRKAAIKESPPARVDEVQSLVSELDAGDSALRAKAVSRLASIFAASPDSAIELVLEQRPVVRAAAIDAIAASGNTALDPFLFKALSDRDSYVAARSARAVAARPDAVAMIRNEIGSQDYSMLLRAAAFLDDKARIQIATELFSGTFKASSADLRPPAIKGTPGQPRPPPPSEAPPGGQPLSGQKKPVTPRDSKEGLEVPGGVPGGVLNGKIGFETLKKLPVLNEDFLALNLVRETSVSTFKVPLSRIVSRKIDSVIASTLQIAWERRERLPIDELIKLLSSSDSTVARLAALNVPRSATKSDIPRIESLAEKLSRQSRSPAHDASKPGAEPELVADLRASIARIRFREQVEGADQRSRSQAIQKGLADPQLADWVWTEYAREALEGSVDGTRRSPTTTPAGSVQVSPLGENMLPRDVSLYVALPSPAAALGKLNNGLANLQTESARSQATLLLMMSAIKAQIAKFFGAQSSEAIIEHLGINPDQPIAFAKWTAEGAPRGLRAAERKAVLVHVSDRDRFEHFLAHYQEKAGNFARLPELVSAITRFLGFAPAILPMGALSVLKEDSSSKAPKQPDSIKYHLIGRDECLGHAIKVFERREATFDVPIKSTSVYLAYFGDAAVLAPDWFSLREVLSRLDNNRGGLAANPEFKRAVATGGDAIYLSSLSSLVKLDRKKSGDEVTESGSLKMSNASWENSYQLSFPKAGWESLFSRFDAKSLASPRELLPRSTLGYIFARPDVQALWSKWGNEFFGPVTSKNLASIWAMDFDKEVVPEFANEFGAAVLSLPKLDTGKFDAPWVVFLKLKTDKLSRAFGEGKLFKESAAGGRPVKLKIGSSNLVAAIKNGYLVFGPNEAAIEQLDQKEKLYTARDFSRAAERAPPTVVAFGGYSLEAAVAELGTNADPMKAFIINAATSMARAFHSQNFYATETPGGLEARL